MTTHQAPVEQVDLVDLKEWALHRVLAKRKEIYVPGVIAPSNSPSSVLVKLDYPEGQQQLYQDIFATGRFDVISDRVPSLSDVSCRDKNSFVEVLRHRKKGNFLKGICYY